MGSMKRRLATAAAVLVTLVTWWSTVWGQHEGVLGEIHALEARQRAIDAYIYGYPLVTMELTRRVMTNVAAPEGTHAPMGQKEAKSPNIQAILLGHWPIDCGLPA